jgi:hypothetical protein
MTDQASATIFPPDSPPILSDDRPRRVFFLEVVESTGPLEDDRGYEHGQACPGCKMRPEQGQEIVRFGAQWWHLGCAGHRMRSGGAAAAWLALGADLAARPSRYTVTETRAIVRQLVHIAGITDAPLCPACGLERTYSELGSAGAAIQPLAGDQAERLAAIAQLASALRDYLPGDGWELAHAIERCARGEITPVEALADSS